MNPIPAISQPGSGTMTPVNGVAEQLDVVGAAREGGAKARTLDVREDGSVLHCFSVSSYCFKVGRLTVPPVSDGW
jgi:hypothetical protein